jgi:hypothetical protein
MKLRLFAVLAFFAIPTYLSATVVGFDDLTNGSAAPSLPSNYAGLTWDAPWHYWTPVGTGTESAPNVAYFNSTSDAGFTFASPVTFSGAWFDGFSGITTGVQMDLYLSNVLVATSALLPVSTSMTFLSSGYAGNVDQVVFQITGGLDGWVVDDITYNAAAVPEPATLTLYPLGLAGLIALRRRRVSV